MNDSPSVSTMFEHVQKAIAACLEADLADKGYLYTFDDGKVDIDGQIDTHLLALAAIKAMREPTEIMIEKAKVHANLGGYGYGDDCSVGDPEDVWQTMIDAILEVDPWA